MTIEERKILRKVGQRLKQYRIQAGLTQRKVFILTNHSPNSICNYEHGDRAARITTLYKLAKLYKCSITDFFDGL